MAGNEAAVEETRYPEEKGGYLKVVDEYQTPGVETELSGIYPHPTDDNLYLVVTNEKPTYKPAMKPKLPVELRNKLLSVNRKGEVVKVYDLPSGGGLFGDLAYGDGHLWFGPLDPPAVWKFNMETGKVVARYPLPGPAGGMEFDQERSLIYVQSYIGHPHLVVVDPKTGANIKSLWSDENCQGMAKVDGDLLTVWSSSWDADAYTELWRLDPETGKPTSRLRLSGIHAAMAPLNKKVAGYEGFITLVHVESGEGGRTVIRKHRYIGERHRKTGQSLIGKREDRFAAIQFSPEPGARERNLERLTGLITEASRAGAKYIALPEWPLTEAPPSGEPAAFAEQIPGPTTRYFGKLAQQLGVWLALSLPEQNEDKSGYYVTAALINDRGEVVNTLRKRVLRHNGEDGKATVGFARVLMDTSDDRGRRIGILPGDDIQSGVPRLADRGADTILVSANWSREDPIKWAELCDQLARQYNVNLVIANRRPSLGGIFQRDGAAIRFGEQTQGTTAIAPLAMQPDTWRRPSSLGLPSVPFPAHQPVTTAVIELGRTLFFDQKLSSSGQVSCSTCHQPEKFFSDGKARGEGVQGRKTLRNVPSLLNAAFKTVLHWDGNPTTIEQQVKYPLTGFAEMNLRSYDDLLGYLRSQPLYVRAFSEEMGVGPQELTREHVAMALATYQRTLISGNSPFDRYYYGKQPNAMGAAAQRGLATFTGKGGCAKCHLISEDYALFTDGKFHRLGIGYVSERKIYADPGVGTVSNDDYAGMFFTPSLRNSAETAPYMHDGSAPTLAEAILTHYKQPDPRVRLDPAFTPVSLTTSEVKDLVEFLRALTGEERYTAQGERSTQIAAGAGKAPHRSARRTMSRAQ